MGPLYSNPLKIISFLLIISALFTSIVYAAFYNFSGSFGSTHKSGIFTLNSIGNAGIVSFDRSAGLDGSILTGAFTLETVGRVVFAPGAKITPPISGKTTDLWGVSGTAISQYAGRITMDSVYYDPVSRGLVGYGMNYGIGRIPFGDPVIIDPITGQPIVQYTVDPTTGLSPSALIGTTEVSAGFEGRVKVLGTIGGNSAFATFYSPGTRFNASIYNSTLNQMKKNIALLTRNVSFSNNPTPVNNTIFIRGNKKYSDIQTYFPSTTIDSLVIVGGDLVVDIDISNPDTIKPKGIIIMKDETGAGGNIAVQRSIKKIQASIFTEGSLYSGESMTILYNDTTEKILTLPENQLYIQGSLISRNTIGGATQNSALCVYGETSCTFTQAVRYDLNYFRLTPASRAPVAPATTSSTRSYKDATLDAYSLIIERDPRIGDAPPPGWEAR